MSNQVDGVERARLVRKTGQEKTIVVHFNPASLELTVSNNLSQAGNNSAPQQYVAEGTAKLTFELLFDTTNTGEDVRVVTEQVVQLMKPEGQTPPSAAFEWGVYKFEGIIESYKEKIDFFAAGGVPLRASVNLTLVNKKYVFAPARTEQPKKPGAVEVPALGGAAGVSSQGGDPRAARDIAAANGQESLRFPAGDSFVVGGGIQLAPPVAFATGGSGGGFGLGGGIGGGIGISGGAGASIGAGASAGVSIGAGASVSGGGAVFGSRASARVTASQGAFAGLRAPAPERRFDRLRIDSLQSLPASSSLGTDQNASFQLGGQASLQGAASLRADVNGSARLSARIQFDED